MKTSLLVAVAALLSSVAQATPTRRTNYVLHEKREEHQANFDEWTRDARASRWEVLPVRIALREQNLHNADKYIMDVADPTSPNFGKHWSAEKVANTFAPSQETQGQVLQWLHDFGIEPDRISHATGRNWIQFDATVDEAENLFDTKYHFYKHRLSGGYRIACDQYSLPRHLREHVDFVMPTIQLDGLQPLAKKKTPSSIDAAIDDIMGLTGLKNCAKIITIPCLRKIYNFPISHSNQTGNQMGIAEWADYLYQPDLKIFFQNYTNPKIPSDVFPEFISIDGGKRANLTVAKAEEVVESALDFQTAYSIIYPQGLRLYQNGDSVNVNSVGTFNIFLDALDASYCTYMGGDSAQNDPHYPDPKKGGYKGPLQCGGAPKSNVISVSYVQIEAALPPSYQTRQCHEWMKMGLQGVSVLFASGDSGVANRYNAGFPNKCLEKDTNKRSVNGTRFAPSFPVNCPYITAVGATQLLTQNLTGGERAVSDPDAKNPEFDFYSGGGFSNVFTLPKYQKTAVTNYLAKYPPGYGKDVFNQSGNARAYPDVSSLGIKIATVYLGKLISTGGTSASAPTVAAIVTLLNEKRLAAGKGPIGFLNPTFYANPAAFNDVTVGNNPGCGTKGFEAQPGWDPVTGLGTPDYEALLKVFMALP